MHLAKFFLKTQHLKIGCVLNSREYFTRSDAVYKYIYTNTFLISPHVMTLKLKVQQYYMRSAEITNMIYSTESRYTFF
jgi:hypothetical protein